MQTVRKQLIVRFAIYLVSIGGWMLSFYLFFSYSILKMEATGYVESYARSLARSDFGKQKLAFYSLPNRPHTSVTNGLADVKSIMYTNDTPMTEVFVQAYNERLAKLISESRKAR